MENVSKKDFLYFQNEILQDIKKLDMKLNEKVLSLNNTLQAYISQSDLKVKSFQEKLFETLSTKIQNKNLSILNSFQKNIENMININEENIKNLKKELIDSCNKYDTIIKENLSFPGFIGKSCKFNTLRLYLEFIDKNIKELIKSKDIQNIDLKNYKDKFNSLSASIKIQFMGMESRLKSFNFDSYKKFDNIFQDKINDLDLKINNIKIENEKIILNINQKYEEINNKINENQNNAKINFEEEIKNFKDEIKEELKNQKEQFLNINKNIKNYNFIKKDINNVKKNFVSNNYNTINNTQLFEIKKFQKNKDIYRIIKEKEKEEERIENTLSKNKIFKEREKEEERIENTSPKYKIKDKEDDDNTNIDKNKSSNNRKNLFYKSFSSNNVMNEKEQNKKDEIKNNNNININDEFLKTESIWANHTNKNNQKPKLKNERKNKFIKNKFIYSRNNEDYSSYINSNKKNISKLIKEPKISSYISSKIKLRFEKLEFKNNNINENNISYTPKLFLSKDHIFNSNENKESINYITDNEEELENKNIIFDKYMKLLTSSCSLKDNEIKTIFIEIFKLLNLNIFSINKDIKNSNINVNNRIEKIIKKLNFLFNDIYQIIGNKDISKKSNKLDLSHKNSINTIKSLPIINKIKDKKQNLLPTNDMIINLMKKSIKNKKIS